MEGHAKKVIFKILSSNNFLKYSVSCNFELHNYRCKAALKYKYYFLLKIRIKVVCLYVLGEPKTVTCCIVAILYQNFCPVNTQLVQILAEINNYTEKITEHRLIYKSNQYSSVICSTHAVKYTHCPVLNQVLTVECLKVRCWGRGYL